MKRKPLTEEQKLKISNGMKQYLSIEENRIPHVSRLVKIAKNAPYKCGWISVLNQNIYYRSSYELEGLLFLNSRINELMGFKSEKIKIPYYLSGTLKIVVPDWYIELNNGEKYLIEIKPNSKLTDDATSVKITVCREWSVKNNINFRIWDEEIIFRLSSTTKSLEEILEATATHLNGERYSLNSSVMERIGEKSPNRLYTMQKIILPNINPIVYCKCGCGEIVSKDHTYCRGHNLRGAKLCMEHREAISRGNIGRIQSSETRSKISKARKGKKLSAEHCQLVSKALTGRKRSKESVLKMIETNKQKYLSGERKAWNKGIHYHWKKNRLTSNS